MSRENSVHVKLSDEADKTLELLVAAHPDNASKSAIAAYLLERALLGEGHGLKVDLTRLHRQGLMGTFGYSGGMRGFEGR